MIVYNPALVMQTEATGMDAALQIIFAFITSILGVFALATAVFNFFTTDMKIFERIAMAIAALLLIIPELITSAIGLGIIILVLAIHLPRAKKVNTQRNEVSV